MVDTLLRQLQDINNPKPPEMEGQHVSSPFMQKNHEYSDKVMAQRERDYEIDFKRWQALEAAATPATRGASRVGVGMYNALDKFAWGFFPDLPPEFRPRTASEHIVDMAGYVLGAAGAIAGPAAGLKALGASGKAAAAVSEMLYEGVRADKISIEERALNMYMGGVAGPAADTIIAGAGRLSKKAISKGVKRMETMVAERQVGFLQDALNFDTPGIEEFVASGDQNVRSVLEFVSDNNPNGDTKLMAEMFLDQFDSPILNTPIKPLVGSPGLDGVYTPSLGGGDKGLIEMRDYGSLLHEVLHAGTMEKMPTDFITNTRVRGGKSGSPGASTILRGRGYLDELLLARKDPNIHPSIKDLVTNFNIAVRHAPAQLKNKLLGKSQASGTLMITFDDSKVINRGGRKFVAIDEVKASISDQFSDPVLNQQAQSHMSGSTLDDLATQLKIPRSSLDADYVSGKGLIQKSTLDTFVAKNPNVRFARHPDLPQSGLLFKGALETGQSMTNTAASAANRFSDDKFAENTFYGLRNISEFASEVWTNPRFQRYLLDVPSSSGRKGSSLFSDVVGVIKRANNLDISDTFLEQVMLNVGDVAASPSPLFRPEINLP